MVIGVVPQLFLYVFVREPKSDYILYDIGVYKN